MRISKKFGWRRVLALCVLALLATSVSASFASAEIIADLQPYQLDPNILIGDSYYLSDINTGGGILIGDKLFDSFFVTFTNSVGANAPGLSEIKLTPIQILKSGAPFGGDYGFIVNGAWSAPGLTRADSTIWFHSKIVDEGYYFKDSELWLSASGVSNDTVSGQASVSENIYPSPPSGLPESIADMYVYFKDDTHKLFHDAAAFDPITEIWVVKDVMVYGGINDLGSAHISEFWETFSQGGNPVPEPGTLALLAFGAIGLAAYAWRKRR